MNSTPTNNIELTEELRLEAVARLEQEFTSNPNFVERLDAILSNISHGRVPRIALLPTPHTENDLNHAFQSLNDLVDEQLNQYSDNEREQIRQRFYNALSATIKAKLVEKRDLYHRHLNAVNTGADTLFSQIQTTVNDLNPLVSTLSASSVPTTDLTSLITQLSNCNRDGITNRLRDPAIPATPPDFILEQDIQNFKVILANYIRDTLHQIDTSIAMHGSTAELDAARTTLTNLNGTLLSAFDTYQAVVRTNLVNPNTGNPDMSYNQLSNGSSILEEAHNTLTTPGIDHIISREVRFTNFHFEQASPTLPYVFSHPVRSHIPDDPYRRGQVFSVDDYAEFYSYFNRQKPQLTPERQEAVEENAKLYQQRHLDRIREASHNHFNANITAGTITASEVRTQLRHSLLRFISEDRPFNINTVAPTPTVPNFENNIHGPNKLISLNLAAIALGVDASQLTPKKLEKKLIEELENDIYLSLNLPDDDDLAEINQSNREAFGEQSSRTFVNQAQNETLRGNLIDSTRSHVKVEIEKEFADKNLKDPKVQKEFVNAMSGKVLQSRLDTINEVLRPKQNQWYHNIPAKLGLNMNEVGLGAGLIAGGGLLYGASSVATFFSESLKSSLAWIQLQGGAAIKPFFTSGTKLIGSAAVTVGSYLGFKQIGNMIERGFGSRGSGVMQKTDILGSQSGTGLSNGGLGEVDTRSGVYRGAEVQRALAEQIAFAENQGATFAKTHKSKDIGLISGGPAGFAAKFKTADHLWEREQQGLQAVIKHNLNNVLRDRTIPENQKLSIATARALNNIYQPNGIEDNFLREFVNARRQSGAAKWTKRIASTAAAAAVGGALVLSI